MDRPEWQPQHGIYKTQPHAGDRAAEYRFPSWDDFSDEAKKRLTDGIAACAKLVPLPFSDVQIVGSTARGHAHRRSDVDVVLVVGRKESDWWFDHQAEECVGRCAEADQAFRELGQRLGVNVTWVMGVDARTRCCYSIGDKRLYGRGKGERLATRLRFDRAAGRLVEAPPKGGGVHVCE